MSVNDAIEAVKDYIRDCEEQINSEFGTIFPLPESRLDLPYGLVDALVKAVADDAFAKGASHGYSHGFSDASVTLTGEGPVRFDFADAQRSADWRYLRVECACADTVEYVNSGIAAASINGVLFRVREWLAEHPHTAPST